MDQVLPIGMALPAQPRTNKWLVTVSVSFGTLMGAIDSSIVNVALPQIRGAVGATIQEITWISTGFVMATVIVMPLTGFLGRLFGQKRVYLASLVLFVVGSALCGVAQTLPQAGALPRAPGARRGRAPAHRAGHPAPDLPGPRSRAWRWRSSRWPSCSARPSARRWAATSSTTTTGRGSSSSTSPSALLGLLMVTRFVHEPDDIRAAEPRRRRAAAPEPRLAGHRAPRGRAGGAAVRARGGTAATTGSTRALIAGGSPWSRCWPSPRFVLRELTATVPAVNLRLFKDPVFTSGTLIGAVMFAMLMASMFLLPLFMQELLGFTATQSGLALMPRVLVMMVATPIVGRLYNRVSPRLLVGAGHRAGRRSAPSLSAASRSRPPRRGSSRRSSIQGVGLRLPVRPADDGGAVERPEARCSRTRPASTRFCGRSAAPSAWPSSRPCSPANAAQARARASSRISCRAGPRSGAALRSCRPSSPRGATTPRARDRPPTRRSPAWRPGNPW